MTSKRRAKACETCKKIFIEAYGDSNAQWERRRFCSVTCNSRGAHRVRHIFDRIEQFQLKASGCWGWSGAVDPKGYGIVSSRKGSGFSPEKAHRVSYEKHNGPIPDGLSILHKCDNPPCTNPEHLFAGTQKDNMQDCSAKGRLNPKSLKNLRSMQHGITHIKSKKEVSNVKRRK